MSITETLKAIGLPLAYPGANFPNPWLDVASLTMPPHNRTALLWCETIWTHCSLYRRAMERVISYFITDLELMTPDEQQPLGGQERREIYDILVNDIGIFEVLRETLVNFACYGNAFVSLVSPKKRMLLCPKCGSTHIISNVIRRQESQFNLDIPEFKPRMRCSKCQFQGVFSWHEENADRIPAIRNWSPHDIEIACDPVTMTCQYFWRPDGISRQQLTRLHDIMLETAPLPMLLAIAQDKRLRFNPDNIYHFKEPYLSGVKLLGWGISRIFLNYRDLYYYQVLRRYNEAIALDYVMPLRVVTPVPRPGASIGGGQVLDPAAILHMGDFRSQVEQILQRKRYDPAGYYVLPFPVQTVNLSGDARQYAPVDLLNWGLETALEASGVPLEMHKGTMQLQTIGPALRLFETDNSYLIGMINRFLDWLVKRIIQILKLPNFKVRMARPRHLDDIQRQGVIIQLMSSGLVSRTEGLRVLGIDFETEQKKVVADALTEQEAQQKLQTELGKKMQLQQQLMAPPAPPGAPPGGAPPGPPTGGGGGMPPGAITGPVPAPASAMPPSSSVPQNLDDILAQAQQIAQELLTLPETQRLSRLRTLKVQNEVLHAAVKSFLDQLRYQMRMQGGQQLMQQQQAMGGPPPM